MSSRLLGNLALAAVSGALVLAPAEWLARRELANAHRGKGDGTLTSYQEHDDLLGWRKRAGAWARFDRREYSVAVRINSHGLRDIERAYERSDGDFRILALGDSFIEAYSVPEQEMLTQRLEISLNGSSCRAEVINAGTAAYGTDQEYLFYRTQGRRYQPDVVVLFFYFNDVYFNDQSRHYRSPKPRLVLSGGVLAVEHRPVPAPPKRATRAPDDSRPEVAFPALLPWIEGRLERGQPRLHAALGRFGLWDEARVTPVDLQMKVFKTTPTPEIEAAWRSTERIIEALHREVRSDRAGLLIAYIPSRMEVRDRDWQLTVLRHDLNEEVWDRGLVVRRLRDLASRMEVPVLDLTPDLREAERGWRSPYYTHDGHWNALGHAVAARAVQGELHRLGWLPSCTSRWPESR